MTPEDRAIEAVAGTCPCGDVDCDQELIDRIASALRFSANEALEMAARLAEDYGADLHFHGGSVEERTGERIAERIRSLRHPPEKKT